MSKHVEIIIEVDKKDLPERLNDYAFENEENPEQGYQFAAECIGKGITEIGEWEPTEVKYNPLEEKFLFEFDIWASTDPGDIVIEISKSLWQLFDMTYFPVQSIIVYLDETPVDVLEIGQSIYDDLVGEKPDLVQEQD